MCFSPGNQVTWKSGIDIAPFAKQSNIWEVTWLPTLEGLILYYKKVVLSVIS